MCNNPLQSRWWGDYLFVAPNHRVELMSDSGTTIEVTKDTPPVEPVDIQWGPPDLPPGYFSKVEKVEFVPRRRRWLIGNKWRYERSR